MADNTGMARLWAGIHWRSDHEQGQRLGRCVAREIINTLQRGCICPPDVCCIPNPCQKPPSHEDLERCERQFRACCHGKGHEGAAKGPQTGAPAGSSGEVGKEQAGGPQEGAK